MLAKPNSRHCIRHVFAQIIPPAAHLMPKWPPAFQAWMCLCALLAAVDCPASLHDSTGKIPHLHYKIAEADHYERKIVIQQQSLLPERAPSASSRLIPSLQGVLAELSCPPSRQMFERFRVTALSQEPEQRLAYFKTHVWPRIRDSGAIGQPLPPQQRH